MASGEIQSISGAFLIYLGDAETLRIVEAFMNNHAECDLLGHQRA